MTVVEVADGGLRPRAWPAFLTGPDQRLLDELYVPALAEAVQYDRCCAYFRSSILAAAARGFAAMIQRLVDLGNAAPRPAIRLITNEELLEEDVQALLFEGDLSVLERHLGLADPVDALERRRLEMLAWLAKSGLLDIRVGVMRMGGGILHAKYEQLEITGSWESPAVAAHYRSEFQKLWDDDHPDVATYSLPQAIREQLLRYAPPVPPATEPKPTGDYTRQAAIWRFIAESPYLAGGAATCDATALVEPWPHQRRVIQETAAAWPEGRLLCDEVGMGKTIEAALVLRRLLAGRGVKRVLILTPASLTAQWQAELREKGGLLFPRVEPPHRLCLPDGSNRPLSALDDALVEDRLILSRETARMDDTRQKLLAVAPWDLVLLDESHAARRKEAEEGEFNSPTLLLGLLRGLQLRGQARSLLLLSATPMQTHPWEPWDLLAVLGEGGHWLAEFAVVRRYYRAIANLRPGATGVSFAQQREARRDAAASLARDRRTTPPPWAPAVDPRDRDGLESALSGSADQRAGWLRDSSPLTRRMHRSTRATLNRYHEIGLLDRRPPQREIEDIRYDFDTLSERRAYDRVGKYIDTRYEILEQERGGKGFVMTIYRRRAASSPQALRCSLERRREGLQRVVRRYAQDPLMPLSDELEPADLDDLPETVGTISAALPLTPGEAAAELNEVDALLAALADMAGADTKRERFVSVLRRLCDQDRSVLVFTQYTDTMQYLRDWLRPAFAGAIGSYSGDGGAIWGDGDWKPVSKTDIIEALTRGDLRVIVCTDAASEGLNLQAASAVINYDLPWNPSRVEQRIGRVDRIGQERPSVRVVNLFLANSVDDRVYAVLRERCGLFHHFVGKMQPVLARARGMLLGTAPVDTRDLEEEAARVDSDPVASETYEVEDSPGDLETTPAGVTRAELMSELAALEPSGIASSPGAPIVIRLSNAAWEVSADRRMLEFAPKMLPLTPESLPVVRLSRQLARMAKSSPLVVETYQEGAFRAACALWVTADARIEVSSLIQLKQLLGAWDGAAPGGARLASARRTAVDQAKALVQAMRETAQQRERKGLEAQVEAVRLRLLTELARLLFCLRPGAGDLNREWYDQMQRQNPTSQRLNRAFQRLGAAWPQWPAGLDDEARAYVQGLSQGKRESRIAGSEFDAAMNDPRWQAVGALERMDSPESAI